MIVLSNEIIVAIITGVCAVFGQWLISRQQTMKRVKDDAARDALLDKRMADIEKKIDIHNGYAEKFGEIGTDIAVIKNDIKTLYHYQAHESDKG